MFRESKEIDFDLSTHFKSHRRGNEKKNELNSLTKRKVLFEKTRLPFALA